MSEKEAILLISQAKGQLAEYMANDDLDGSFHICQEFFGLEPDYIDELI